MIRNYISLALFLLLVNNALIAQADSSQQFLIKQIYSAAEKEYGIQQELINAPLFENKNQDANGHPYFLSYYNSQGSVNYRGKQYSNLKLRYDIHAQQVLLVYPFDTVEYKLHLQKEFITEFTVGGKKFINEAYAPDEDARFYQVIGDDLPIKVLYFWEKYLSNLYASSSDKKMFSPAHKDSFILIDNKLLSYKGNSTFARNFSSKSKTAIKKYFREKKIKVNLASDYEMELLVEFINSLAN